MDEKVLKSSCDVHFGRDSVGHEVDVIIDLGRKQIPIEIKSGQTAAKFVFLQLLWLKYLRDKVKNLGFSG